MTQLPVSTSSPAGSRDAPLSNRYCVFVYGYQRITAMQLGIPPSALTSGHVIRSLDELLGRTGLVPEESSSNEANAGYFHRIH